MYNTLGNSGGLGGLQYFFQNLKILGRTGGRGPYKKFPQLWGYGYFLKLHIIYTSIFFFKTLIIYSKSKKEELALLLTTMFFLTPLFMGLGFYIDKMHVQCKKNSGGQL